MRSIATQLKRKMTEHGLSVHALEKKAGLKPSALHNILYGRSKNPTINILQAVSQALNCSVSDLIGDELEHKEDVTQTSTEASPWHPDLYLSCMHMAYSLFSTKEFSYTKKNILDFIEEIYTYSLQSSLQEVDKHFAEWLLQRIFKL